MNATHYNYWYVENDTFQTPDPHHTREGVVSIRMMHNENAIRRDNDAMQLVPTSSTTIYSRLTSYWNRSDLLVAACLCSTKRSRWFTSSHCCINGPRDHSVSQHLNGQTLQHFEGFFLELSLMAFTSIIPAPPFLSSTSERDFCHDLCKGIPEGKRYQSWKWNYLWNDVIYISQILLEGDVDICRLARRCFDKWQTCREHAASL